MTGHVSREMSENEIDEWKDYGDRMTKKDFDDWVSDVVLVGRKIRHESFSSKDFVLVVSACWSPPDNDGVIMGLYYRNRTKVDDHAIPYRAGSKEEWELVDSSDKIIS